MKRLTTPSLKSALPGLLVLLALLTCTRFFNLDQFVTTDEAAWFNRSANFYYALGQRDFAATYQREHIGAFTMWTNTLAFLVKFPEYRGFGQGYLTSFDRNFEQLFKDNGTSAIEVLATGRLFMSLALSAAMILIYLYLGRLAGWWLGLAGAFAVALDPFFLALSRTAHLDAPMGTFLVLSALAFTTYLDRGRHPANLLVSGAAGGLALAAKLPGLLVVPTVASISVLQLYRSWLHKGDVRQNLTGILKAAAAWLVVFCAVFVAIWPAMWVQPGVNTVRILRASLGFAAGANSVVEFDEEAVPVVPLLGEDENPVGDLAAQLGFYLDQYAWRSSPFVLFGLILLIYAVFRKMGRRKDAWLLLPVLMLTAVVPTLFMAIPDKHSLKYITPFIICVDILAGFGWGAVGIYHWEKLAGRQRLFPLFSGLLILSMQVGVVVDHHPYYFTYYNPVLGGSRTAGETRFVGVGEGLDQAAAYLNGLPDAETLVVRSWYGAGSFSYFFSGRTITIPTGIQWSEGFFIDPVPIDYIIVYTNQWYRRVPDELFDILEGVEPVETIRIEGIEYARIYRVNDLPVP